jgi:hypothetical protein
MLDIAHVNFRIPSGSEPEAESFWCGLMGFTKLAKPAGNTHPGLWFTRGNFEVHVSPDDDFAPVTRAHTAFVVDGLTELVDLLKTEGLKVNISKGTEADVVACFLGDPFGNRLELISPEEAKKNS